MIMHLRLMRIWGKEDFFVTEDSCMKSLFELQNVVKSYHFLDYKISFISWEKSFRKY